MLIHSFFKRAGKITALGGSHEYEKPTQKNINMINKKQIDKKILSEYFREGFILGIKHKFKKAKKLSVNEGYSKEGYRWNDEWEQQYSQISNMYFKLYWNEIWVDLVKNE